MKRATFIALLATCLTGSLASAQTLVPPPVVARTQYMATASPFVVTEAQTARPGATVVQRPYFLSDVPQAAARPVAVTAYHANSSATALVPNSAVIVPIPSPALPPNHYVGRGLIGQPKLYVKNQPIRNALRYLTL